ncbi:MAG: aspartate/glutamate racemase family protein [Bryobacteraceae bacterium]
MQTLGMIHTSPVLIPAFTSLAGELTPEARVFHMVDESLIKNTIADGSMSRATARRVYRMIESAGDAGADVILVTCSSIGAAVALARPFMDVPVVRIDEAMAEQAVTLGSRVGVAATLSTTLGPTLDLLEATAAAAGRSVELTPCLCEGAFEAVVAGDTATHDRLLSAALADLVTKVDAVVLAQASMARVADAMPAGAAPILSSPRLAMERVRVLMA